MTTTPAPTDTTGLLVHIAERSPEDRLAYLLEKFGEAYHAAYVEQTNSADARRDGIAALIQAERDAAREELAKTRADLDARNVLHTSLAQCRAVEQDYTDLIRKWEAMETVVQAAKAAAAYIVETHPQIRDAQRGWFHPSTLRLVAAVDALANPATTAEPADEPKATCGAEHTTVIYPIKQPTTVVCTAHEGKRHVNALTGFSWLDAEPAAS